MAADHKLNRKEYEKLKKEQKRTRTVGLILLVAGAPLYPLAMHFHPVLVLIACFVLVGGVVLLFRSVAHQKFAPLREPEPAEEPAKKKTLPKPQKKGASAKAKQERKATPPMQKQETAVSAVDQKILGCLLGGAAGDALGYAVEFLSHDRIVAAYGEAGIRSYEYAPHNRLALISDDTQMTLFTAEGLLVSEGDDLKAIYQAYLRWLETQNQSYETRNAYPDASLMQRRELYSRRAPGTTCLSALSSGMMGTVTTPINSSKGCGGVMRVAPIAFLNLDDQTALDKLAAQAAAITHGHPLGYLPAALLVHILHTSIYKNDRNSSLRTIVEESLSEFAKVFAAAPYLEDLIAILQKAIRLSDNRQSDVENIHALGEGWVAEETLAIAVYCALRHADNFSEALIAAVNHNGDSDSTGAVTGNLLGAYLGESKIEPKWKKSLELYSVIAHYAERFGE